MISLDTECTGLDLRHGAKPFLVTTCDEQGNNTWWEWEVQPENRQPIVDYEDLGEIQAVIDENDWLVLQNPKFDLVALQQVFLGRLRWDWAKVYDTLLAGHLLASNQPHDLAAMVLTYLNANIYPYEERLKQACTEARQLARDKYPDWRVAKKGLPEMPSAEANPWKDDMWLLRAIARKEKYPSDHPWWTLCSDYANVDSASTLALFKRQRELLKSQGLWGIYLERLKILPVVYAMEEAGVTINRGRLEKLTAEYSSESARVGHVCTGIAKDYGYELSLPKAGNNKSLLGFVFGPLGLPVVKTTKKGGKPSLDKLAMQEYEETLPERSKGLLFIKSLRAKRRQDTAMSYMEGYRKHWLPQERNRYRLSHWYRLHPSLNPTGTITLRWSSSNPNEQNISKQEEFNIRYCFGPAPGREWWSLDAENIELRIPAYEAGETEMIDLFERREEPPYYGSYHLLIFDTLHPEKFAKHGAACKEIYASTWYQWTKNGNFAVQYGATEHTGTADRAYHVPGAQQRIQRRFKKVAALNAAMIKQANEHGYVETIPDKTVDPKQGYPLFCSRSKWGSISHTIPLNYHVSGTAMWWMMKAMIRVQGYLDELNRQALAEPSKYHMVMQVHDELVFDFPNRVTFRSKCTKQETRSPNLPVIREVQKLMEQGGEDIGVPTPVNISYHPKTWSEGEKV